MFIVRASCASSPLRFFCVPLLLLLLLLLFFVFYLWKSEPEGVRDMQPLRDREAQVFHGQLQHRGQGKIRREVPVNTTSSIIYLCVILIVSDQATRMSTHSVALTGTDCLLNS